MTKILSAWSDLELMGGRFGAKVPRVTKPVFLRSNAFFA